jgi:hypothetical protein
LRRFLGLLQVASCFLLGLGLWGGALLGGGIGRRVAPGPGPAPRARLAPAMRVARVAVFHSLMVLLKNNKTGGGGLCSALSSRPWRWRRTACTVYCATGGELRGLILNDIAPAYAAPAAAGVFALCRSMLPAKRLSVWGPPKKSFGVPKPAARAELAACSDRTKAQQRRERPGCVAY